MDKWVYEVWRHHALVHTYNFDTIEELKAHYKKNHAHEEEYGGCFCHVIHSGKDLGIKSHRVLLSEEEE